MNFRQSKEVKKSKKRTFSGFMRTFIVFSSKISVGAIEKLGKFLER